MPEEKTTQAAPINTRAIITGMVLVFIVVQLGFHATYGRHFPGFEGFTWIHHVHGALMASWVLLLVLQPVLIHKKKFAAHRFLGKLSYVIAPLMLVSMVGVARYNYHSGLVKYTVEEIIARQSITWMQIFLFILFYSLAISYKKLTAWHLRFMIATAILMTGPSLGRFIVHYGPASLLPYATIITLVIKTGLAAVLLLIDGARKKSGMPYAIVLAAFLLADLAFHARYSDAWQAFGRFVIHNVY